MRAETEKQIAEIEQGDYLPRGTYRMRAAEKIQLGNKVWIGFEGAAPETQDISIGWIYGSAGPRLGRNRGLPAGIKVADPDLRQLYNVLVESRSTCSAALIMSLAPQQAIRTGDVASVKILKT